MNNVKFYSLPFEERERLLWQMSTAKEEYKFEQFQEYLQLHVNREYNDYIDGFLV